MVTRMRMSVRVRDIMVSVRRGDSVMSTTGLAHDQMHSAVTQYHQQGVSRKDRPADYRVVGAKPHRSLE